MVDTRRQARLDMLRDPLCVAGTTLQHIPKVRPVLLSAILTPFKLHRFHGVLHAHAENDVVLTEDRSSQGLGFTSLLLYFCQDNVICPDRRQKFANISIIDLCYISTIMTLRMCASSPSISRRSDSEGLPSDSFDAQNLLVSLLSPTSCHMAI